MNPIQLRSNSSLVQYKYKKNIDFRYGERIYIYIYIPTIAYIEIISMNFLNIKYCGY